jgi:hypothetical protein
MNKLLTTIAIVASLATATSSANASIFGDVARAANRVRDGGAAKQVERDSRPAQQGGTASAYSWMNNKDYMQCLRGMKAFARNDAEAQQGVRNCNQQFGSR